VFLLVVIITVALFPTYAFLRHSLIPVTATTCVSSNTGVFLSSSMPVSASNSLCKTMTETLNT